MKPFRKKLWDMNSHFPFMPCIFHASASHICMVGQNRIHLYTVHDRKSGDFPANNTVYSPYVYIYIYGSGQPYTCVHAREPGCACTSAGQGTR